MRVPEQVTLPILLIGTFGLLTVAAKVRPGLMMMSRGSCCEDAMIRMSHMLT